MQAGPPAFGASRGPLSGDGPPPADQETAVTAALPPPGEAEPAESGGSAGWVWRPGLGTGDAVSGLRWRFCFFFFNRPPFGQTRLRREVGSRRTRHQSRSGRHAGVLGASATLFRGICGSGRFVPSARDGHRPQPQVRDV